MKAEYRNVFLLFLILLFSVTQSTAQQESIFKKFAGTYITGHEFGGGSIKLEADGTFSDARGSDDGTEISTSGSYTLLDGVLHFLITKQAGKRAGDDKEFNLLNPEERNEMFRGLDKGEVEREVKLLPIEWSKRIYLIYENELKNFTNAINLGIEPRTSLISERYSSPWYGSFYLRSGDERKKVVGNPNLPEKWRTFLLSKPLVATVIGVQKIEKREFVTIITATVNKGTRNGLKVGMQLLVEGEEPSLWNGTEVISVKKGTAKIQAWLLRNELKVGDKLRTRYKPKMLYR